MKRNETYNTKQKDLILSIIKKQNHEFTVKDIYEEVKGNTGLTTIYRLVIYCFFNKILHERMGVYRRQPAD